jgi:ParB family chromosome partitioning protein
MSRIELKKPSLGRGLSALLGESLSVEKEFDVNQTVPLPVTSLRPGKYQPRQHFNDEKLEALIHSIREKGIIQPLIVRPLDESSENYEIIAGERRWRAARTLNLDTVPVIVKTCTDQEALETALIENIQRDDLNPIEEAEAYQRLLEEFSYTQEQLARSIGKSRSHVANILRLNNLPSNIKQLVQEGKMSAGHARSLLTVENAEDIAKDIVEKGLNVREAERLAQSKKTKLELEPNETDVQSRQLENQIHELIKLPTQLKIRKSGATLTISFNSFEEIDDFMNLLRDFREFMEIK